MIDAQLMVNAPSGLLPGAPIELLLDAELYDDRRWAIDVWGGSIVVKGNGRSKRVSFTGNGKSVGPDRRLSVSLGLIGSSDVPITVELWANDLGNQHFGFGSIGTPVPVRVKTESLVVTSISGSGDNGDDEDDEDEDGDGGGGNGVEEWFEDFPWKWAGVAAGAVFAGLLIRRIRE